MTGNATTRDLGCVSLESQFHTQRRARVPGLNLQHVGYIKTNGNVHATPRVGGVVSRISQAKPRFGCHH